MRSTKDLNPQISSRLIRIPAAPSDVTIHDHYGHTLVASGGRVVKRDSPRFAHHHQRSRGRKKAAAARFPFVMCRRPWTQPSPRSHLGGGDGRRGRRRLRPGLLAVRRARARRRREIEGAGEARPALAQAQAAGAPGRGRRARGRGRARGAEGPAPEQAAEARPPPPNGSSAAPAQVLPSPARSRSRPGPDARVTARCQRPGPHARPAGSAASAACSRARRRSIPRWSTRSRRCC